MSPSPTPKKGLKGVLQRARNETSNLGMKNNAKKDKTNKRKRKKQPNKNPAKPPRPPPTAASKNVEQKKSCPFDVDWSSYEEDAITVIVETLISKQIIPSLQFADLPECADVRGHTANTRGSTIDASGQQSPWKTTATLYNSKSYCFLIVGLQLMANHMWDMIQLMHPSDENNRYWLMILRNLIKAMVHRDDRMIDATISMRILLHRKFVGTLINFDEHNDAQEALQAILSKLRSFTDETDDNDDNPFTSNFLFRCYDQYTCPVCQQPHSSLTNGRGVIDTMYYIILNVDPTVFTARKYPTLNDLFEKKLNPTLPEDTEEKRICCDNLIQPVGYVERMPQIAIIQLEKSGKEKTVKFDSNWTPSVEDDRFPRDVGQYSLFAVIHKLGSTVDRGHYTISLRQHNDDEEFRWIKYDDESRFLINEKDVLNSRDACLLFYKDNDFVEETSTDFTSEINHQLDEYFRGSGVVLDEDRINEYISSGKSAATASDSDTALPNPSDTATPAKSGKTSINTHSDTDSPSRPSTATQGKQPFPKGPCKNTGDGAAGDSFDFCFDHTQLEFPNIRLPREGQDDLEHFSRHYGDEGSNQNDVWQGKYHSTRRLQDVSDSSVFYRRLNDSENQPSSHSCALHDSDRARMSDEDSTKVENRLYNHLKSTLFTKHDQRLSNNFQDIETEVNRFLFAPRCSFLNTTLLHANGCDGLEFFDFSRCINNKLLYTSQFDKSTELGKQVLNMIAQYFCTPLPDIEKGLESRNIHMMAFAYVSPEELYIYAIVLFECPAYNVPRSDPFTEENPTIVSWLLTRPQFRSVGLASKLMQFVCLHHKFRFNHYSIVLGVSTESMIVDAFAFYKRLGFDIVNGFWCDQIFPEDALRRLSEYAKLNKYMTVDPATNEHTFLETMKVLRLDRFPILHHCNLRDMLFPYEKRIKRGVTRTNAHELPLKRGEVEETLEVFQTIMAQPSKHFPVDDVPQFDQREAEEEFKKALGYNTDLLKAIYRNARRVNGKTTVLAESNISKGASLNDPLHRQIAKYSGIRLYLLIHTIKNAWLMKAEDRPLKVRQLEITLLQHISWCRTWDFGLNTIDFNIAVTSDTSNGINDESDCCSNLTSTNAYRLCIPSKDIHSYHSTDDVSGNLFCHLCGDFILQHKDNGRLASIPFHRLRALTFMLTILHYDCDHGGLECYKDRTSKSYYDAWWPDLFIDENHYRKCQNLVDILRLNGIVPTICPELSSGEGNKFQLQCIDAVKMDTQIFAKDDLAIKKGHELSFCLFICGLTPCEQKSVWGPNTNVATESITHSNEESPR